MPKPKNDYPVRIRLQELGSAIDRRAEAETGGNRSRLIRLALKSYLEGGASRIADMAGLVAELKELRADLARVGNNLNQIAHYFNVHETADAKALETLFADCRRIFWDATQLTKAVIGELEKDA